MNRTVSVHRQNTDMSSRSRPVFNVTAQLSFEPEEISTDRFDCSGATDVPLLMVNLSACFQMLETTKSSAGRRRASCQCHRGRLLYGPLRLTSSYVKY